MFSSKAVACLIKFSLSKIRRFRYYGKFSVNNVSFQKRTNEKNDENFQLCQLVQLQIFPAKTVVCLIKLSLAKIRRFRCYGKFDVNNVLF